MAEEKTKQQEKEKKVVDTKKEETTKKEKTTDKTEEKTTDKKETKDSKKETSKKEEKKDQKKEEKKIPKKDQAIAKGLNFRASMKNCSYICRFIKNKPIDKAIEDLEDVIKMKRAVPFRGEIPHRKGKGMMSGRYPVKAAGMFINLLKSLKGNVLVNQMDLDKTRIRIASASWAARPVRRGGRKFKRTNVLLIAKEVGKK